MLFDYTSGTISNVPGFNSLYHDLIAYWAAYNYSLANQPGMATGYMNEILRKEASLIADYSKRDEDERTIMSGRKIRYI